MAANNEENIQYLLLCYLSLSFSFAIIDSKIKEEASAPKVEEQESLAATSPPAEIIS
ncbi:MAG: hypothetical protein ABFD50_16890 [Smithella sp.]